MNPLVQFQYIRVVYMVLNVEIYNGHIRQTKEFPLTVAEVESTLQRYEYTGTNRVKDPSVEKLILPPIVLSFYSCIYKDGSIPSEMDLVEEYLNQENIFSYLPNNMVAIFYNNKQTTVSLDALIARILRTYPSLVRDLHFYLMAYESGFFSAVRYSVEADYAQGIDIRVRYNDKWYNVGLYVSTKRSLFFKKKKLFRHRPVSLINLELHPKEAHIVGDFMLYSREHVNELLLLIK